jgi:HAD superfamily hydrolase (TIGR01662 family)
MIEAFVFDFNDTLIHSPAWMDLEIRILPESAFALFAENGHIPKISDAQLDIAKNVFKNARVKATEANRETSHIDDVKAMVSALGMQNLISSEIIEETVGTLHRNCIPNIALIEGVDEMLASLKSQGYRIAIISNAAFSPILTWTLAHYNLLEYFENILVSCDAGIRKPNPNIFKISLTNLGLEPNQVVYVGDDFEKDIEGSSKVGMKSIWLNPDGEITPADAHIPKYFVVKKPLQIATLGKKWKAEN